MTRLICGITPEHWTLRVNTSPYPPSETTPSWIRAPPESLIPITGHPILAARSMILHIFSAITSPSEPPNTVKSWLNTHTRRPSIVPWPGTTASPYGRLRSISKSFARGELALRVLLVDGHLTGVVDRLLAQPAQLLELFLVCLRRLISHGARVYVLDTFARAKIAGAV